MDPKCIVITGSTRGIGRGLAEEFLVRGHQVVLNGRGAASLEKIVGDFRRRGYQVEGVAGDVCSEGVFEALFEAGKKAFGKVDIWINNAGVPQSNSYFTHMESCEIRQLTEVNILALMLGTRTALRFFLEQGHGVVFNMEGFGSDGRMREKLSLYGTTKRAVHYFTRSVSKEITLQQKEQPGLNSRKKPVQTVRLGILSPGMVRTDFLEYGFANATPEEQELHRKVFNILAEDVGTVVPFLVKGMLRSRKPYDRIVYLNFHRMFPKILRLMFIKTG